MPAMPSCRLKFERGRGVGGGAGLNDISHRTELCLCLGRGGVYGLDLTPYRQYVEKIRNFLNKQTNKQKNNNITDAPFEHYYSVILVVIRERILPDK